MPRNLDARVEVVPLPVEDAHAANEIDVG